MSAHGKPRVLITGAGGLVGRGIRPALVGHCAELVLVGRSPIETIADNETVIQGSINDPEIVARALDGIDAVVHLACSYGLDIAFEDTLETNYRGFVRLVEAFIAAGGKSFVFASTHHGWGLYPRGAAPLPLTAPAKPDGWYGVSKVFGEAALGYLAHAHGFSATSLRIGNANDTVMDERRTHMWISYRDLAEIVRAAIDRRTPGHIAAYTTADCPAPFFDNSDLDALDCTLRDRIEDHVPGASMFDAPPLPGIFGESLGGAYSEANLRTDIETWRKGFGKRSK